jgi:hypothetical protein
MQRFIFLILTALIIFNAGIVEGIAKKKIKKKVKSKKAISKSSEEGRVVTPLCNACEETAASVHSSITRRPASYPSKDEWSKKLTENCASNTGGTDGGCDQFLTKANLNTIAAELFEMSQEGTDTDVVDLALVKMQELLCFELTDSCPDGARGTNRHVFKRAENDKSVSLTLISKLTKGAVRVFWIDPDVGDANQPSEKLTELIAPGSSQHHNSFRYHRFRLLGPGASWDDPWSRADLIVQKSHEQTYALFKNASFEPGLPLEVSEPAPPGFKELPPQTWNEEEDGAWKPALVRNPRLATNRMYYLREVDPVTMALKDEL